MLALQEPLQGGAGLERDGRWALAAMSLPSKTPLTLEHAHRLLEGLPLTETHAALTENC